MREKGKHTVYRGSLAKIYMIFGTLAR